MHDISTNAAAFTLSRRFDASPATLWHAWSDLAALSRWWGPQGFEWLDGTLDFTPGGMFHYHLRSTSAEMWGKFAYETITPEHTLIFLNGFANPAGDFVRPPFDMPWPMRVRNTLRFTAAGDQTLLTLHGLPVDATPEEHAVFQAGHAAMTAGFGATWDRLAAFLAMP